MTAKFTDTRIDLTDNAGYQFEYQCEHCGRPYRTSYKPAANGIAYKPQAAPRSGAKEKAKGFFSDIGKEVSSVWHNGVDSIGTNGNSQVTIHRSSDAVRPQDQYPGTTMQPQYQPQQYPPQQPQYAPSPAEYEQAAQMSLAEAQQMYHHCPTCDAWVCDTCFDAQAGQCRHCVDNARFANIMGGATAVQSFQAQGQPAPQATVEAMTTLTDQPRISMSPNDPRYTECPSCKETVPALDYCGKCGKSLAEKIACPSCGEQTPASGKFCCECGQPLQLDPPACPDCGESVEASMKFCPNCGHSLKGDKEENDA